MHVFVCIVCQYIFVLNAHINACAAHMHMLICLYAYMHLHMYMYMVT